MGVYFSGDHAFGFNLHTSFGKDDPVKPPGDDHAIPFNLTFDLRAFAKDYGLLRDDVPFDVAIDSEGPGDRQRALEGHTLIDKSSPLLAVSIFC